MKIEKCVPKPQPVSYLLELTEQEFDDLRRICEDVIHREQLGYDLPSYSAYKGAKRFKDEFDKKR